MVETRKIFTGRAIVMMVLVVLIAPFLPMIISSHWDWPEAWVYAITSILTFVGSRALAGRRHPDLLVERARFMQAKDTKPWDKVLAPLLALGSIFILVVAGVDRLFGWSPGLAAGVNITGLIGLVLGYAFSSWAPIENRFFSGTVRIQSERGHHVVSSGPYRIVRHPMYAGYMVANVGLFMLMPSLMNLAIYTITWWAQILRVTAEERHLLEDEAYRELTRKVRYRLIPGLF